MHGLRRCALGAAAIAATTAMAACGRDGGSPAALTAPRSSLGQPVFDRGGGPGPHFVHPAADAPTIANPVIAFTATKGRDTTVTMYYRPRGNSGDSTVFAEFRVRARSLSVRPDGRAITDGESVQITMTLVDPVNGIIDFQPSGLRFSPRDPARLKISYANANRDLDGNGVVDSRDALLARLLHIVCRETPNSPWLPIASVNDSGSDDVEALVRGFTGYAIDY